MKNKLVVLLALTFGLAFSGILSGCTGDQYSEEEKQKVIEKASPILEEYIKTIPEAGEIKRISMLDGIPKGSSPYGAHYLSNQVQAYFQVGDRECTALVNLEDGKIYSDVYRFDVNAEIARQLKPYCEKYGYTGEYEVRNADFDYFFVSHDLNKKGSESIDVYSYIAGLIPAEFSQEDVEERADAALMNAPIQGFTLAYHIENGEPIDPRILVDYLTETGNYRLYNDLLYFSEEYSLSGWIDMSEAEIDQPISYRMTLSLEDIPEKMPYYFTRSDYKKEREFSFIYTKEIKEGMVNSYADDVCSEYDFPFEVTENELIYTETETTVSDPRVFFEKDPGFTKITKVCYENDSADKPTDDPADADKLTAQEPVEAELYYEDANGFYYMRDKGSLTYFFFNDPKIVVTFEK